MNLHIEFPVIYALFLSRNSVYDNILSFRASKRYFLVDCFWPGLGLPSPKGNPSPKAIVVIPKINSCQNIYGKKPSKITKYRLPLHYKKRLIKITMYLGLDIIITLKFTTNFDRCARLNILNCLTKNFKS